VGPRRGAAGALFDLAARLEFESVLGYASVAEVERHAGETPIAFFLFAEMQALDELRPTTEAIRSARNLNLRFAPLVYFSASPSIETVKTLIGMGFDDVIAGPFSPLRVRPRLARQLDAPLVYYETTSYFGPDRRRDGAPRPEGERRGGGQFRRIEIIRRPGHGIDVISDDLQVMV
jgi:hypothetical protein